MSALVTDYRRSFAPHTRLPRRPKVLLALVFLPLLVFGGVSVGWAIVGHVASAVVGAVLVELFFSRVERQTWVWPSSALLSGLIVAMVLAPQTPPGLTLAIGAQATTGKYLFANRRWHVFNPAALALLVAIPLFGVGQSWWGALAELSRPWLLLLLVAGAVVVDRVNRFPLVLAFGGTYFGLFTLVALFNPAPVAEMFRPPFVQTAVFFACFMLTDPPTSPARSTEQVGIGVLVGLVSCLAQLVGLGQAYLLLGLAAGNLAWFGRRLVRARAQAAGR